MYERNFDTVVSGLAVTKKESEPFVLNSFGPEI